MKFNRQITISLITLFVLSSIVMQSCKEQHNTLPIPMFTINPSFGTVDSVFRFDASAVSDSEDPSEELQVRWDWESDSIFDTEFTTEKIATHQFAVGGTYNVTLEVRDPGGLSARLTQYLRVAFGNRAPNANFVVLPGSGFLQDEFIFDASSVSDAEDDNTTLRVRWDFDGDTQWDTDYSTEKIATKTYEEAGTYLVKLQVVDSEGLTGEGSYSLTVGGINQAPNPPQVVAPAVASNTNSTRTDLQWSCVDPDGDQLKFDVYFGTSENPAKVAEDFELYSYPCPPLDYETEYFWKVVAKDPYDHVVSSQVWSFSTFTPLNEMGTVTDPRDGKVYKTVKINDKIWFAENLNIGTMINASSGGDFGDGYQKDNNKTEKFCFGNKAENCDIYGGLYQWDEAMGYSEVRNAEGICPPGWHIPNTDEWKELEVYYEDRGDIPGEQIIWGGRSGFEMIFSGYLIFAERKFYDKDQAGYGWSSDINPDINHLAMGRSVYNGKVEFKEDTFQRVSGLPVRCIKDY